MSWADKLGKWTVSNCEEYWPCDAAYDTKAQAVAAAKEDPESDGFCRYVGRMAAHDKWPLNNPLGALVLDPEDTEYELSEAMEIGAEDEVFEFDNDAMEAALWAAFKAEMERQGAFPPRYYKVCDIEQVRP